MSWQDDQVVSPAPAAQPSTTGVLDEAAGRVNNAVNYLGTQFTKGLSGIAALPRTGADLNQQIAQWAAKKLGGSDQTARNVGAMSRMAWPGFGMTPSSDQMNKFVFGSLGAPEVNSPSIPFDIGGQKFDAGKIVDQGVQAIPGMIAGPGNALAKTIPAFTAGAAGETAGQSTEGTWAEVPARLGANVLGFLLGKKAATPLPAHLTPNEARAVATAKEAGVPMTVSQETGRLGHLESAVSKVPFSEGPFAKLADKQAKASQRVLLNEAGIAGERTDPESMRAVHRSASDEFEAAKRMSGDVTLGPDFFNKAGAAVGKYEGANNPNLTSPGPRNALEGFFDKKLIKGGPSPQLTNEQYQEFRRTVSEAAESATDTGAKKALRGIRTALDDAMGDSLPADKAKAWAEARKHWENYKLISKAAARGTVDSRTSGNLSPNALSTALRQHQGDDVFARTTGGLNDIAHMNAYLHDTLPYSGTPGKLGYHGLMALGGGALAGGGGELAGGHAGGIKALLAAAAGLTASHAAARAMTGAPGGRLMRAYLVNQALADPQAIQSLPLSLAPSLPLLPAPRQ